MTGRILVAGWCFALLAAVAAASPVQYTFTQNGWTGGSLSGSFSGTPEANGTLTMSDLTSFTATFDDANGTPAGTFPFSIGNLEGFSFSTTDPFSLEFAAGFSPASIVLCSGASDSISVCGVAAPPPVTIGGGVAPLTEGFFVDVPLFGPYTTHSGATVSAVATTATPEPGTAPLLALMAGLLILAGGFRRVAREGQRTALTSAAEGAR